MELPKVVTTAVVSASACLVGAGCFDYLNEGTDAQQVGAALERPEERRRLRRVCRRVDRVTEAVRWDGLERWRIRVCHEIDCERTNPRTRDIYIRRAGRRVRHEYVHACLFSSGLIDGHHAWMRRHCRFCHGSPNCAHACRRDE